MSKCVRCGKHGLFLFVNSNHLCANCAKEAERDVYRAKLQQEAEALARRRRDFTNRLEAIPKVSIPLSDEKIKKRPVSDVADLKYSRITAKSNRERLGSFVVIDTETTSLAPSSGSIIEVSALRFEDFTPVELFTTLIEPDRLIPAEATEINNITNDMVLGAPAIWQVIPSLQEFIGIQSIVGHNLPFDLKFLYRAGLNVFPPKQKLYDTLDIVSTVLKKPKRKWDKELEEYDTDYESDWDVYDYKLQTLCDYYHIYIDGAHRSAADCLATGLVFNELVDAKVP